MQNTAPAGRETWMPGAVVGRFDRMHRCNPGWLGYRRGRGLADQEPRSETGFAAGRTRPTAPAQPSGAAEIHLFHLFVH